MKSSMSLVFAALGAAMAGFTVFGEEYLDEGEVQTIGTVLCRVVPDGKTVETVGTGPSGCINKNGAETEGKYKGTAPVIVLGDNSRLRYMTNRTVWPSIVVSNNCHAVIEFIDTTTPCFRRSIILLDGATLTVNHGDGVAVESVTVGNQGTGYCYYPYVDLRNLVAQGKDTTSGKWLTIDGPLCLVSLPATLAGDMRYTSGYNFYLMGDNPLWPGIDNLTNLPAKETLLSNPGKLNGRSVRVNDGETLSLAPFAEQDVHCDIEHAVAVPEYSSMDNHIADGRTYCFNVHLSTRQVEGGAIGSRMAFSPRVGTFCTFNGRLTGEGIVTIWSDMDSLRQGLLMGDLADFAGVINPVYSGSAEGGLVAELMISNTVPNATAKFAKRAGIRFKAGESALALGAIEATGGESSYLTLEENMTLTVGSATGAFQVLGPDSATLVITEAAPGAVILEGGDVAMTMPANCRRFSVAGRGAWVTALADGSYDLQAIETVMSGMPHVAINAENGGVYGNTSGDIVLRAGEGVSATIEARDGGVTAAVAGKGSFTFEEPPAGGAPVDLERDVHYWFDFSRRDTLYRPTEGHGDDATKLAWTGTYGDETRQCVERCVDWRHPNDEARGILWQGMTYSVSGNYAAYYPLLVENGYTPAGGEPMNYLRINNGRMPFGSTTGNSNNGIEMPAQRTIVVMVYNSAEAGKQLVGCATGTGDSNTASYPFYRETGLNKPFFKNAALVDEATTGVALWTNGVKVVGSETNPLNGWQVITLDMGPTYKFKGLGFCYNKNNHNGGGTYGEILIFTNQVSELTRITAEKYLADKWGLPYGEAQIARKAELEAAWRENEVSISTNTIVGAGVENTHVSAGTRTVRLTGNFAGTLDLQGGRVLIDGRQAYDEATLPSAGRLFWLDGDNAASRKMYIEEAPSAVGLAAQQIRAFKDPTVETFEEAPCMVNVTTRMPYLQEGARGLGPERGWISWCNLQNLADSGNFSRYAQLKTGYSWANVVLSSVDEHKMAVRTAFVALDSTRGGGNPLFDTVSGTGKIGTRTAYTDAIWKTGGSGAVTAFIEGVNRLDGRVVDQAKGFTGVPEVLSVQGTAAIDSKWYINNYTVESAVDAERRSTELGEILYYGTELSSEQVEGIEAYLMRKWLGRLPAGFSDVTKGVITGTGEVVVASAAQRPTIAAGFSGKVAVGGDGAFTMAVEGGAVKGSLACPNSVLDLPAACTLTLDFASAQTTPTELVTYPLVDCASYANPVEWTLVKGANAPRRGRFERDGNRIVFRVPPAGFSINLR